MCAWSAIPRPNIFCRCTSPIGAAGDDIGRRVFGDRILGKEISAYQFG